MHLLSFTMPFPISQTSFNLPKLFDFYCNMMPCHALSCYAMSYHVMPCRAVPCYAPLRHVILCPLQLHAGRISEEAGVYLAHLTSYVLQTVRYRLTQPMALRIDRSEGNYSHRTKHLILLPSPSFSFPPFVAQSGIKMLHRF